jgi:4-hydroxybutyrate dehydrogenase/sulfolactaldehyde 3-reductase
MMKVGFLGLGAMGKGMAHNLLVNGHELAVFDANPRALTSFADLHPLPTLQIADCPAHAALNADVVICMLPTTVDSREALFGKNGATDNLRAGSIVMDMGTGHPGELLALGEDLEQMGVHLVDAPVNRAPPEAMNGTLLVMVGGEKTSVDIVMPLLECMCDTIHRMGKLGTGLRMKLANNYMSMINLLLTAEGLLLAERAGIDRSQAVAIDPRKVLAGDLTPDFRLDMCLKDITLALELGISLGLSLNLGALTRNQFALAKSWGRSGQDCTAIFTLLQEINNSDGKFN